MLRLDAQETAQALPYPDLAAARVALRRPAQAPRQES